MAAKRAIGVDLGGTKILAGVVDEDGRVYDTVQTETPTTSEEALLDALEETVKTLLSAEIVAVGFGVPARVNPRNGATLGAVNIPLPELRLRDELIARLGVHVVVENDAGAATLAEYTHGAGRGSDDLVMLTLGTGVGGGLVVDGRLYRGWAEFGHMVIVEDGEPCHGACSGRGHVEAYCSGHAADRVAREVIGPDADAHDLVAQRHPALDVIGKHLGTAIGSLVNLFNPHAVLIGGGFGVAAGELLFGPARHQILRDALAPAGQEVRLALAELGADAGMIGAALAAFEAA